MEPEPKLWTKVEPKPEPKINNFGSATLVFCRLRLQAFEIPSDHETSKLGYCNIVVLWLIGGDVVFKYRKTKLGFVTFLGRMRPGR